MDQTILRQLAVTALARSNTLAGTEVYPLSAWPTSTYPLVLVYTPHDRKESLVRSAPEFTTTVTLTVIGRVENASLDQVTTDLDMMRRQILQAILTNFDIIRQLQQFATITTRTEVNADGSTNIGQVQIDFDCEFFEAFDPLDAPLAYQPVASDLTTVSIGIDLAAPFDSLGSYPANPLFPGSVPASPRTSGPDGRDEGGLNITLPQ